LTISPIPASCPSRTVFSTGGQSWAAPSR
jgi:hypothetical protein